MIPTFAYAGFLFGALAISIPIILHFLARKPVIEKTFPSFMFLYAIIAKKKRRNNINKWLVLLLRCAALAAFSAAFAMPFLPEFKKTPDTASILLWDDSFSMTSRTCNDELRRIAGNILDSASPANPVQIGVVSKKTNWSGKFFSSPQDAKAWLSSGAINTGTSSFEAALRLADAKLKSINAARKKIIVVTDNHLLPWANVKLENPLSPGIRLELAVPERLKPKNVAVNTVMFSSPYTAGSRELSLKADIQNFSDSQYSGEILVKVEDKIFRREKIEIQPESSMSFDAVMKTGGEGDKGVSRYKYGSIALAVDDDVKADNEFYFALNPEKVPLIFATAPKAGETDYIGAALNPSSSRINAEMAPLNTDTPFESLKKARLVVVSPDTLLSPPFSENLDRAMNAGAKILVFLDPRNKSLENFIARYGLHMRGAKNTDACRIGTIDFAHPVFKKFADVRIGSLFDVIFFNPPRLETAPESIIIASFHDGSPLFVEHSIGEGKLFVFCSPLDRKKTSWVGHSSFLPLIRELVNYCRSDQERFNSRFEVTGVPLRIEGLEKVRRASDGVEIPCREGAFLPEHPGCYIAGIKGVGEMILAVNSAMSESDPSILPSDFNVRQIVSKQKPENTLEVEPVDTSPSGKGKDFWRAIMLFAGIFFLGELCLSNRSSP